MLLIVLFDLKNFGEQDVVLYMLYKKIILYIYMFDMFKFYQSLDSLILIVSFGS